MLKRRVKQVLALILAGTMMFGNLPATDLGIQVQAEEAVEAFSVSFVDKYAAVGQALAPAITGASDATYIWTVGGVQKGTGETYTPTESDLNKWIEVTVTSGKETLTAKLYCSKLPVVYIDTEGGQAITSKEVYINANIRVQGNDQYNSSKVLYNGKTEIRGRGNSTWSQPKKPYRLKLDKKTDMFGMGKSKHWVLLANYLDESLMRNTLAYDLSGEMGMEHLSTVWVEVVMNGEYVGNYQFCENIRVDDTRIDIFDWEGYCEDAAGVIADAEGMDKTAKGNLETYMAEENMQWITSGSFEFNGKTYKLSDYESTLLEMTAEDYGYTLNSISELSRLITGGYILELDEYYDEVSKFKTDNNQPIMFKNPEFVYTNTDMMEYVREYVQAFEDAVQSPDYRTPYWGMLVHYTTLYDLNALIDYWLVTEIFYNEEINKKSTYMYKPIDDKMVMGPIWDMDWSSGAGGTSAGATDQWATNYFNTNAQANQWYKYIVKDPYFLMKAQERYWQIRDVEVQQMLDSIDTHIDYLKESGQADYEVWRAKAGRSTSFASDSSNLKKWLNAHVTWMDGQMETKDTITAAFFTPSKDLELSLFDTDGNPLPEDPTELIPADVYIGKEEPAVLQINNVGNYSGEATVYVNGVKKGTVALSSGTVTYDLAANLLIEPSDRKNVVEVKVIDDSKKVLAENYITVKATDCVHLETEEGYDTENHWTRCSECGIVIKIAEHSYEWVIDQEATPDQPGIKHEECTCGMTINENTTFPYVPKPADPSDSSKDIPTNIMLVTTGDQRDDQHRVQNVLDGNNSTIWHTVRSANRDNHWIQFELTEDCKVNGLRYLTRQDNSNNGVITGYEIEVSNDGKSWTTVASGSWESDKEWKLVTFEVQEVKYVRFKSTDSISDNGYIYGAAAEMRLVGSIAGQEGVTDTLKVSFSNAYAEVGTPLVVETSGEGEVSYQWKVGGVAISNDGNSYTPTENDLEKWIEVKAICGTERGSVKMYCSKLPVVYIDTENGQAITSKEVYIDATIKLQGNAQYNSSKVLYEGATEIRGRGNSTWAQPKKPYRLKLDKKTDAFGMGKSKHWVLLANYLDESLMRNTLAYDLSGSMGMEQMSTVWVDVIMNGEYVGNYQFCENIRVDDTRIDIFDWEGFAEDVASVIAKAENMDDDTAGNLEVYMAEESMQWITSKTFKFNGKTYNLKDYEAGILELLSEDYGHEIESIDKLADLISGGYILELDEYYDEVSKFKTNSNQPIMFKNPEFVYTNTDMMAYVQTYVQAFEDAVKADDYTAKYDGADLHYSELYDLDALVDYWLINEIFFNEELNKKSTYMYKDVDSLMYMGPIWDMDWSSGGEGSTKQTNQWATLYFNANAQANQWYKDLVKDPYFLVRAQERYWEIRDLQVQDMLDIMDDHYEYLKESGAADGVAWGKGDKSFGNDYANLNNWLNSHVAWLDEQMVTEDALTASFVAKYSSIKLALTDENGIALAKDQAEKAPANAVAEEGTIGLSIKGVEGTAKIFVNGKVAATVAVEKDGTTTLLTSEMLTAKGTDKDVIEVKVFDGKNNVTAAGYVTVKVAREEEPEPTPEVTPTPTPGKDPVYKVFPDVKEGAWYVAGVQFVYENGLMSGSNGLFNPTADITRAQLVTTLYRLAGEPEVTNKSALTEFSDVADGKYYTDAVCWAYAEGVTTGTDGKFNPTDKLTRQQMAAFFFRYAEVMGMDTTARGDYSSMVNADKLSGYAKDAMAWAVGTGLISGSDVTVNGVAAKDLNPRGNTTRAQVATILMRFCAE